MARTNQNALPDTNHLAVPRGPDWLQDPLNDALPDPLLAQQSGGQQQDIVRGPSGSVHQRLPEDNPLEALYDQAANAVGPFSELVEGLITSTGAVKFTRVLKPYDRKVWQQRHPDNKPEVKKGKYVEVLKPASGMGSLKDKGRAQEKAKDDYGGDVSKLLDIVRATLTYKDCAGMLAALDGIAASPNVKIARIKGKLDAKGRGALGYGDVNLGLQVEDHICELQLQYEAMAAVKPALHHPYETYRSVGKGKGIKDVEDPKEQAMMKRAVHESQDLVQKPLIQMEHDENFGALIKKIKDLGGQIEG